MRSLLLFALVACGGHPRPVAGPAQPVRPLTGAERMLPLLPDGAQIVVEIDLDRLRKNEVVGEVATRALGQLGADIRVPGLPLTTQGSPLATAQAAVFAAYGVGTAQAATIGILETRAEFAGGTKLAPDLVALGPDDWIGQVQARATIMGLTPDGTAAVHAQPLSAPVALLQLRGHAMPEGAPGAVLRITARLPFDARVALARITGLESAPAQLSLWADVADDLAIVIDADAADPGDRGRGAARRLAAVIRAALAAIADVPVVRGLGVPNSLTDARLISQGTWVRAIIAIGPRHLARAVERARAMLGPS